MRAYVISLARRTDRREHITRQLGRTRLSYEVVNAVDGRDVDLTDAALVDPAFVIPERLPGVFGCILSHYNVYRKIIDDGPGAALVIEDDVVLPADLDALAEQAAQHMSGAEVVLLNFHSLGGCWITENGVVSLPPSHRLVQITDKGYPCGAGAYLITREASARMAGMVLPVSGHADDWLRFYREGAIDRLRCVVPMPVADCMTLRTTKNIHQEGSLRARVLESVAGSRIPPFHQMLALRRRRYARRYWGSGRTDSADGLPGCAPPPVFRETSPERG